MEENPRQALKAFLDAWAPEFAKSVEMFTGQAVTVEPGGNTPENAFDPEGSVIWQGQIFEREGEGSAWIGTPLTTCTALTETLAEDSAGREALYREMLRQSFEGAAHVLSAGGTPRIVCKQAIEDGNPLPDVNHVEIAWLVVPGQQRAPIFVGVDSAFAALLPQEDRQLVELPQEAPDPPQASSRLMDRLADLELPVAVVLGRARLQIRDALKLNPGSMIEMDRRVNEPVEIVVHNAVVARGEVVAIGGNYGVRIQEVISRKDRVALQASAAFRSSRAHLEQH